MPFSFGATGLSWQSITMPVTTMTEGRSRDLASLLRPDAVFSSTRSAVLEAYDLLPEEAVQPSCCRGAQSLEGKIEPQV